MNALKGTETSRLYRAFRIETSPTAGVHAIVLLSNATMLQSHGLDMADQPVQVTQLNQAMEKLRQTE